MDSSEIERNSIRYQPRAVAALGHWSHPPFTFKIYGLGDRDRPVHGNDRAEAQALAASRLADVAVGQGQTCPGFIIYHTGSDGLTLQVHWWVEGCILCHDHVRLPYEGKDPIACLRPYVVGCVWELALIDHEKTAWQKTMMSGTPSVDGYLQSWFEESTV